MMKAMRRLAGVVAVLALMLGACTDETKVDVARRIHPEAMPTMTTRNVSTMISDSGVTQYRIVAPLWEVYDEGDNPHWRFPEGLYLRKYDRKFNVIATIAADSATYFKNKSLWRLDGRVEVTQKPSGLFLTQQMFWDQSKGIVYGDSFIHIENATHMMEGYGFRASQDFSQYSINRPLGIFPAERDNLKGPAASTPREPGERTAGARPGGEASSAPRAGVADTVAAPSEAARSTSAVGRPGM